MGFVCRKWPSRMERQGFFRSRAGGQQFSGGYRKSQGRLPLTEYAPPPKKFVGGGDLTSSIQVAGLVALMNPIGLSAMAIPVSGFLRNSTLHFPSLRFPQLHFASSSPPFLIILRHTVVTCLYPRLAISICCGFSQLHGLLFSRLILLWIFVVDRRS